LDELRVAYRQHEDARLARRLDDAERVNVRAVLDAGRKAPRPAEEIAAVARHRLARARALPRDDGQPLAAEKRLDRIVLEVRGALVGCERGGHLNPSGGRIAVGQI